MTRFARAKGSKASNERVPENATPWSEMKKQFLEKNQQGEENKKKRQADQQREQNYKQFLKQVEEEQSKNSKWAEFPTKKKQGKAAGEVSKIKPRKLKELEENNNKANETANKPPQKKKKKVNVLTQKKGEQEQNNFEAANTGKKRKKSKETAETTDQQPKKKKLKRLPGANKQQSETEAGEANKTSENGMALKKSKFEKRNNKSPKFATQKKGAKNNKQNSGKFVTLKSGKPVASAPLSEEDLKKIEKKKQKKVRQVEKRKLVKENEATSSQTKTKRAKFQNKQKPERRKELQDRWIINGKVVEIAYVDSFPIKKEDAERIKQLRKEMISKGLPRSEINIALKLERRKAEKALARERKKVCFNCRQSGHNLSECPSLNNQIAESSGTGICFKCGSTEHTHFECKVVRGQEFKYAQCFICQEQGHIARQCPDNARGLYPKGGACKVCGDVTHLKKDCPKYQMQQQQLEQSVNVGVMNSEDNPDNLDRNDELVKMKDIKRPNKIIKF